MNTYTVQATGGLPFTFTGALIAAHQQDNGDSKARGVAVAVYHTEPRGYVLTLEFTTQWDRERNVTQVIKAENLGELAEDARKAAENIVPAGVGHPPGVPHWKERQDQLVGRLQYLAMDSLTTVLREAIDWNPTQ